MEADVELPSLSCGKLRRLSSWYTFSRALPAADLPAADQLQSSQLLLIFVPEHVSAEILVPAANAGAGDKTTPSICTRISAETYSGTEFVHRGVI